MEFFWGKLKLCRRRCFLTAADGLDASPIRFSFQICVPRFFHVGFKCLALLLSWCRGSHQVSTVFLAKNVEKRNHSRHKMSPFFPYCCYPPIMNDGCSFPTKVHSPTNCWIKATKMCQCHHFRTLWVLFFWVLCRASISNVAMKLQKLILVDDGFTQEWPKKAYADDDSHNIWLVMHIFHDDDDDTETGQCFALFLLLPLDIQG